MSDRLASLLVVTGVVFTALRWALHCPHCVSPVLRGRNKLWADRTKLTAHQQREVIKPPRPGRANPRHRPQLQRQSPDDFEARGVMFEKPAKRDIDYALSMLMHEARRRVADEKNPDYLRKRIKVGALKSNRVVVTMADAADKIHAASMAQAKRALLDFVQRMERPATEITAWARPHLRELE